MQIEEVFGVELFLEEFFVEPSTIMELSAVIERRRAEFEGN
jgi:hypothetical protein